MAVAHPADCPEGANSAERVVRDALMTLSDEWHVSQDFHFRSPIRPTGDGQIDFFVVHPVIGFIVLEVKGGILQVQNSEWYQVNQKTGERVKMGKKPVFQATHGLHTMIDYVKARLPKFGWIAGQWAIVFPFVDHFPDLGPSCPPERAWDAHALKRVQESIDTLVAQSNRRNLRAWSCEDMDALLDVLAPNVDAPGVAEDFYGSDAADQDTLTVGDIEFEVQQEVQAKIIARFDHIGTSSFNERREAVTDIADKAIVETMARLCAAGLVSTGIASMFGVIGLAALPLMPVVALVAIAGRRHQKRLRQAQAVKIAGSVLADMDATIGNTKPESEPGVDEDGDPSVT